MHRSTILLSLSLAFASSPALAQTGATVWSGISAQVRAAHVAVARDQTEWESLWRNWVGTAPPRGLPPGSQGVAVFIGPKHTGGYGVEVRGVDLASLLKRGVHDGFDGASGEQRSLGRVKLFALDDGALDPIGEPVAMAPGTAPLGNERACGRLAAAGDFSREACLLRVAREHVERPLKAIAVSK